MAQVTQDSTELLARYIKYLESQNLIDFDILGDSEACVYNQAGVQKHVFLAKQFGLDMHFEFNMYLFGPYSESLAEQYYALAENRQELYEPTRPDLPQGFDSKGFLDFVRGRSYDWLEVASTLIKCNYRFKDRNILAEMVENIEYRLRHLVPEVLDEVERAGLVRFAS